MIGGEAMLRTIYHGSSHIIERPVFGGGKPYNDYGLGFYCTEELDMAKEWAAAKDRDGYANCYEIDDAGLSILNLNDDRFCILHWLAILLKNREFDVPARLAFDAREYICSRFMIEYEVYDLMIGYRADDSYFSFAQDFINGAISYRQLNNAMHLGKLGEQFVLKSERAFERLKFVRYEIAHSDDWYQRQQRRDRDARREYFDTERNRRQRGDLYVAQIIDEEMGPDDPRLRQDLS